MSAKQQLPHGNAPELSVPEISVVVPFFGVEDYIAECLESIREQTFTDFEVICVDDGSLDGSRAIADDYAARDPRFRVIEQENGGLSAARNFGTEHASAPYIMWVDSDDILAPRALEQLHATLEFSGSDFASGHVWRMLLNGTLELSRAHQGIFNDWMIGTHITEMPLLIRDRMVWNKLWRRSFWDEKGYSWPPMQFEDHPVTLQAHLEATAVDIVPIPMYVWRDRPSGTSISQSGKNVGNVSDRVRAATIVLDTVDELGTPEIRELVHSYVVDVDLLEVMTSMLAADPENQPAIADLGHTLASRLDPDLVGLANPAWMRGYEALLRGDDDFVRNIARWHLGERSPATYLATGKVPGPAKRRIDPIVNRWRRSGLLPVRKRSARMMDRFIENDVFHYRFTMNMSRRYAQRAKVQVSIGSLILETRTSLIPNGLQIEVDVPTSELRYLTSPTAMEFLVHVGPQVFRGRGIAYPDESHGVRRGGHWVLSESHHRTLHFRARYHAHVITRASVIGQGKKAVMRLHLQDSKAEQLSVLTTWPDEPLSVEIHDGIAEVPIAALLAEPADDPVVHVAERRLVVRRPNPSTPSGWSEEPVFLIGSGTGLQYKGRMMELLRNGSNEARLSIGNATDADDEHLPEAPQQPALDDETVTISGHHAQESTEAPESEPSEADEIDEVEEAAPPSSHDEPEAPATDKLPGEANQ